MEGAAVAQACHKVGVDLLEVRAISNQASYRDMRSENIVLAIEKTAAFILDNREGWI